MERKTEMDIIEFQCAEEWRSWLAEHADQSKGVWLKIKKKDSKEKTVSYAEALDEALCFGWIDGQKKPFDEYSWLQKFSPRGAKSIWSKVNIRHIERLTELNKMEPAGLLAVAAARADGRWDAAYDAQSTMTVPDDFIQELSKNKKALAFYNTLNRANVFAIVFRLQTAKKPETRQKRLQVILGMLSKGQKFH